MTLITASMRQQTNSVNREYGHRLINAGNALSGLNELGICVVRISLDTACPVIEVQRCRALTQLGNAWTMRKRGGPAGRTTTMQVLYRHCRVMWEE